MKRFIKPIILIISAVLIVALWRGMINLNFVMMFILLLIFMILPAIFKNISGRGFTISFWSSIFILVFGLLTVQTLGNYFNPEKVFTNNDHHALRVDGINLKKSDGFVICANSSKSFFDKSSYNGTLEVVDVDDTMVTVELNKFSHPVYLRKTPKETGVEVVGYQMLNVETMPQFTSSDSVVFVGADGKKVSLAIKEEYNGRKRHTASYYVNTYGGKGWETLEFDSYLKTGYSLESVLSGIVSPVDFSGVNIVRTSSYPTIDNVDIKKAYKDSVRYALEFSRDSKIKEVIIKGNSYIPGAYSEEIEIPVNKVFYVGFGPYRSESVKFSWMPDGTLALKYELPKYQYLKTSDNYKEGTVMFTTSIVDNGGDVIPDLSENIILFDFFDNADNVYHMFPSYLSFVKGRSNEEMVFTLYSSSEHKSYSHLHTIDYVSSNANAYFPAMKVSGKPDASWLVSVENFKNTTPFGSKGISWFILIVTICAVILLNMNDSRSGYDDRYALNNPRFSYVEYVAYLLIIAFLAIRLFLMWRITVFPPVTMITKMEFDKFRDESLMKFLYAGASVFFVSLFIFKKYCTYGRLYNIFDVIQSGITDLSDRLVASVESRFEGDENDRKFKSFINSCIHDSAWFLPVLICMLAAGLVIAIPVVIHADGIMLYAFVAIAMVIFAVLALYLVNVMRHCPTVGRMSALIVVAYAVIFILVTFFENRIVNIFVPVLTYFALELLATYAFAPNYNEDIDNIEYGSRMDESHELRHREAFSFSVVLLGLTAVALFIADGGYGTMFLLYAVFSIIVKLLDVDTYWVDHSKQRNIMIELLVGLAVLFAMFYKLIMVWLMNNSIASRVGFFSFMAVLIIAVLWMLAKCFKCPLTQTRKAVVTVSVIAACAVVCWLSFEHIDGSHMEYRTMVHMEGKNNPSVIMSSLKNNTSVNKFMQASLNDWILDEYYERGREVEPVSWGKDDYFKLLPHSKTGALWFAQTTDIVLSRYIIAEHSELLAILFILAYLGFFLVCSLKVISVRWGKTILVSIPLLLMIQSLMIWMANTRRFIFFGQDFPLISATSKLSILFFFALMLILVIVALGSKENETFAEEEAEIVKRLNKQWMLRYALIFGAVVAVLVIWGQTNYSYEPENNMYSMRSLMKDTEQLLKESINEKFITYQEEMLKAGNKVEYSSDMSAVVTDFFNKYPLNEDNTFLNRILRDYERKGSRSNSVNDLVHIKKVKYQDAYERETIRLEFAVNKTFYDVDMPDNGSAWKGDVIEGRPVQKPLVGKIVSHPSYVAYLIPGTYLYDNEPVILVKAKKNDVSVVGHQFPVTLSSDSLNVIKVTPEDNIYVASAVQKNLRIDNNETLARNVMINGMRSFVYPMQSQLYWMRDFSMSANKAKDIDDTDDIEKDLPITLNKELISAIDKIYYSSRGGDKAVVVADGNGYIRAIADRRSDDKHRINPNDTRQIGQISDSLYIEGDLMRPEGRLFFENYALQTLRRGPGSTQKPLVWTAVTSQYNTGWWKDLKLHRLSKRFMPVSGGEFYAPMYSGIAFNKNHQFKSVAEDEGYVEKGDNIDVDLFNYMKKSSNYYNSLLVYIGSFTKQDLDRGNVFKKVPSRIRNKEQYDSLFPIINYGKRLQSFNMPLKTPKDNADAMNQLLYKGFATNFGLHISPDAYFSSLYPGLFESRLQQNSLIEDSQLDHASRFDDAGGARYALIENAIRRTAVGAKSSWRVTPLKMAEMYGRMASFNRNYTLTFSPDLSSGKKRYDEFELDSTWNGKEDEYFQARGELFRGLQSVMRESGGTAESVFNALPNRDKAVFTGDSPKYFIYAKTGTINGKENRRDVKDHLLAVVITDTDLTKAKTKELKDMKFYVIYMVDYAPYVGWQGSNAKIISSVINSSVFKEYMGGIENE